MAFVYPNTLQVNPAYPYNTSEITASAYIGGDALDVICDYPILGYTKTNIHLLMKLANKGITWARASEMAVYDCSSQCCFRDDSEHRVAVPDNPGARGWRIEFQPISVPVAETYEFMAIDDGDYLNHLASLDSNRVATRSVIISPDPEHPVVALPPSDSGTTSCVGFNRNGSFDPMCILDPSNLTYLYGAIGLVILLLLVSGGKKK